jgi:hypothetical protein
MDIGSGIVLGSTVIGSAAVIIKWISASGSAKSDNNGIKDRYIDCSAHSGITAILEMLKSGQEEIRSDIKELLSRG